MKAKWDRFVNRARQPFSKVAWVGAVLLVLVLGYLLIELWNIEANTVAAVASGLAALGAMQAARESSHTARDA